MEQRIPNPHCEADFPPASPGGRNLNITGKDAEGFGVILTSLGFALEALAVSKLPQVCKFTGTPGRGWEALLPLPPVLIPLPIPSTASFSLFPSRNAGADGFEEESSGGEASGRGQDRGLHAHHGTDGCKSPAPKTPGGDFPLLIP